MDLTKQQQFDIAKFAIDGVFCKLHVSISQAREFLNKATTLKELEEAKAMLNVALTDYYYEMSRTVIPTEETQVKQPRIF